MACPRLAGARGLRSRLIRSGISLVEMLVALTLGILVLFGVVQVLSGSRAAYRLNEAQVRLQEAGRFASQTLARDLRMARSLGCGSIVKEEGGWGDKQTLNVVACPLLAGADCSGPSVIGASRALGYSTGQRSGTAWLADLPPAARTAVGNRWLRGDVLVAWGVVGPGLFAKRKTMTEARTEPIGLSGSEQDVRNAMLTGNRLALITACEGSDIFAISGPADPDQSPTDLSHGTTFSDSTDDANSGPALRRLYNPVSAEFPSEFRARVLPFDLRVYFICCVDQEAGDLSATVAPCSPTATDYDPVRYRPSLCRWSASERPLFMKSLLMDVADLRATFDGEAVDPKAPPPQPCSRIADSTHSRLIDWASTSTPTDAEWITTRNCWDRVDTVRIELLLVSPEEMTSGAARAYNATGTGLGADLPADRRLYEALRFNVLMRATGPWW